MKTIPLLVLLGLVSGVNAFMIFAKPEFVFGNILVAIAIPFFGAMAVARRASKRTD